MKKLHPDFPVYVINDWNEIKGSDFDTMVDIIIRNKEKYRIPGGASFWIQNDEDGRFKVLYDKFYKLMKDTFGLNATADNYSVCNVYHSTKEEASEVMDSQGRIFYHNHKHVYQNGVGNPTSVVAVYYVNIPDTNSGFIDFRLSTQATDNGEIVIDKDMRYHQLAMRPHPYMVEPVNTLTKEISYQPKNGDLVLFPSYLDHRPHRSLVDGHRVAVNFELKTGEHPDESFAKIEKVYLNQ
jgi:hypothetical protein